MCLFLQPSLNLSAVAPPKLKEPFIEDLKAVGLAVSHDPEDRVFRAHGTEPPSLCLAESFQNVWFHFEMFYYLFHLWEICFIKKF